MVPKEIDFVLLEVPSELANEANALVEISFFFYPPRAASVISCSARRLLQMLEENQGRLSEMTAAPMTNAKQTCQSFCETPLFLGRVCAC